MPRMTRSELAMWFAPAGTAAAGAVTFVALASTDDPTTDRAERLIGGTLAATPFLCLLLVQVACALSVGDRTGPPRRRGLWGVSLGAAVAAGLVAWVYVQQVARGYPWEDHVALPATLVALLVLPLLPAWTAQTSPRSDVPERQTR